MRQIQGIWLEPVHFFFIVVKELSQVLNCPGLWKAGRPLHTQGVPEPRPHSVPTPVLTASARDGDRAAPPAPRGPAEPEGLRSAIFPSPTCPRFQISGF